MATAFDPYSVSPGGYAGNFPSPGGGGGGAFDWDTLGGLIGGFGQAFGSPDTGMTSQMTQAPSADEMGLQAYLLSQLYAGGPNPLFSYGANYGSQIPMELANLARNPSLTQGQQGFLGAIRDESISAGRRGLDEFLADAQRSTRDTALSRGMDNSSVELWGYDQANKAGVNRMADLIGQANQTYAGQALQLPFSSANVLGQAGNQFGQLAQMGQQQQGLDGQQGLNLFRALQEPRMHNFTGTSQKQGGSASQAGGIGDMIGPLAQLLPFLLAA